MEFLDYRNRLGLGTAVQRQIHGISVYHMLRTPEPKQLSLNYGIKESTILKKKRSNSISKSNRYADRRLITS